VTGELATAGSECGSRLIVSSRWRSATVKYKTKEAVGGLGYSHNELAMVVVVVEHVRFRKARRAIPDLKPLGKLCPSCVASMIERLPSYRGPIERSQEVGETLHSDLCIVNRLERTGAVQFH